MGGLGYPVFFDATHSVQTPGEHGNRSGGHREFIPGLARAAAALGVAGLYLEVHPEPDKSPCDGPNIFPLRKLPKLLSEVMAIDRLVKTNLKRMKQ
jgi:2-dehydro-3-deoxyphosphooctonate aldolase (KDO 8-P synthase)